VSCDIPQDAITRPWWEATRTGKLLLQQCSACEAVQHPPRAVCLSCGSGEIGWMQASGDGRIDSFTVVARQVMPDLPAPYVVARVRLREGPLILTNIVADDHSALRCEQPVALSWRPLSDGRQLPIFAPARGG
jgi:uncharacterized OB-fold protein